MRMGGVDRSMGQLSITAPYLSWILDINQLRLSEAWRIQIQKEQNRRDKKTKGSKHTITVMKEILKQEDIANE